MQFGRGEHGQDFTSSVCVLMVETMSIQGNAEFPLSSYDRSFKVVALSVQRSVAKRALDIAGALFGLLFLLPLLITIALLIKATSRGPVIFRQRRTGYGGKVFSIYKFRTMRVLQDGDEVTHATRGDSRISGFGAVLRRTSLDELPQLFNVLVGDMSLVGPRPHAVKHDAYYSTLVSGYDLRFCTRPGITGLAQISGYRGEITSSKNMAGRVALDLAYISNWSFFTDIKILFHTVLFAPFHRSAY